MSKVTAVMMFHDQLDLTLRAAMALAPELEPLDGELLLVDQASSPEAADVLQESLAGSLRFRIERNDANETWARAANRATGRASSPYVLFLDNDTEILPRALSTLIEVLDQEPQVAAVGPRLLYPTGQLQEAGLSLPVWLVPMPVGQNAPGDDPRFNFPRRAFAVSTTCLLVRRKALKAVSGFDEGYVWGFEAADLAMGLRKQGFHVYYEPRAACIHEAGATLGARPGLSLTDANRKRFLERWGVDLMRKIIGYLSSLDEDQARSFLVFGTGEASRHLANTLEIGGFQVTGFLTTNGIRRVGPLPAFRVDQPLPDGPMRILIGTPFVREAEDVLAAAGLLGRAALPVLLE